MFGESTRPKRKFVGVYTILAGAFRSDRVSNSRAGNGEGGYYMAW